MKTQVEEEIEEFLWKHPETHFLQSNRWAQVKENWEKEFIVVRNESGYITGTMSILLRKVPILNRYMMYAPRGFVCDTKDKETLRKLTEKAKEIAKKYKAFVFRLDPAVPSSNKEFKMIMSQLGYKTKKQIKTVDDVIQPKYVMRLQLTNKTEEEIFQSFHEKTRYNIRLAIKRGVTIREGTADDLNIFYKIMQETGERDHFFIRNISYFQKIYNIMYPGCTKLFIAEYKNIPIAVAMPILYGNKVWYLYGGSSNEYRNVMPTYLLQWEMIKWGLQEHCDIYDFRGITGYQDIHSPQYGVYRFKKGFCGQEIEFIDELTMVFHPVINSIWNMTFHLYKQIWYKKENVMEGMKKLGNKKYKEKLSL